MAKKRIHQIAKELDIASADVLFHAKELGFEVKTASSGLTEEEEELLKLALLPEDEPESESEVVQRTRRDNSGCDQKQKLKKFLKMMFKL